MPLSKIRSVICPCPLCGATLRVDIMVGSLDCICPCDSIAFSMALSLHVIWGAHFGLPEMPGAVQRTLDACCRYCCFYFQKRFDCVIKARSWPYSRLWALGYGQGFPLAAARAGSIIGCLWAVAYPVASHWLSILFTLLFKNRPEPSLIFKAP